MDLSDNDELVEVIENLVGASSDNVTAEGKEHACELAQMELNWSLPQTSTFRQYWIVERARRHFLYILLCESAHKFRFKEIHLHNRFSHYHQLIKQMDKQFKEAIEARPLDFDVNTSENTDGIFGLYITTGFVYNYYGQDLTYRKWE